MQPLSRDFVLFHNGLVVSLSANLETSQWPFHLLLRSEKLDEFLMALLFYLSFHLGKIALELLRKGVQILDFVSTLGV